MKAKREIQKGFEAIQNTPLKCGNKIILSVTKVLKAESDTTLLMFALIEINIFSFLLQILLLRSRRESIRMVTTNIGNILHSSLL